MSKKYTGNYTNTMTKVIKGSDRLECQVTEDGTIYLCNGFWIYKMNPMEYASLVQPVVCCEAGNWRIDIAGKRDRSFDAVEVFKSTTETTESAATLEACPMVFRRGKTEIAGYYNAAADFSAMYNHSFMDAIAPGAEFRAVNALSAAVAYSSGEPFAMVLPIKSDSPICRAVKAYFVDANDAAQRSQKAVVDKFHDQLAAYENELSQARSELDALREQNAKQAEELAGHRGAKEVQREEKQTAEAIAARFSEIPGVITVIKGAQTSAPVVWISGEVQQNAAAIRAAGARWSAKRSAYYFRVA